MATAGSSGSSERQTKKARHTLAVEEIKWLFEFKEIETLRQLVGRYIQIAALLISRKTLRQPSYRLLTPAEVLLAKLKSLQALKFVVIMIILGLLSLHIGG
jgi:hypothetical protein